MINFDSLSLKALISEIEPILTEGRVQKVQQPSKNELLLTIRALRETRKLYICVDPKYPHAALLSVKGEELRNIEIPQKPPMFCMLLRKHMEGCKINAVSQPDFDRILEIKFDSYSELGEKVPMVLACEFMDKYSNLILYVEEDKIIQGCAHFVSGEKSRKRELAGGYLYVYPPHQDKLDLSQLSKQEFSDLLKFIDSPVNLWLNKKFGFISKALATEICIFLNIDVSENKITAISQEKISQLYDLLTDTMNFENINPSISKDKKFFSIIGIDKSIEWQNFNSVNEVIDLYFGYQVFNDKFLRLKNYLSKVVKGELKKLKGQLENIGENDEKKAAKEDKKERYRQYADIIMANLYKIPNNSEFAEVENFFDENKIIRIPLDKKLSPAENAQKYYKLYNKAKNAAVYAQELAEKIYSETDYLESIKESVNHAESLQDLKEIEQELISQNFVKSNNIQVHKKGKQETIKLAEFVSSDGFDILLGKNNKQNDFLLKIAAPEDIWLHTQNIHGSHVLVKLSQSRSKVTETALHEAVYLAAYYSQARESSNVPVVYTKRKFVKKPAGSKPGFVIFTHEKTLWVNPEQAKLPTLKSNN